MAERWFDMILAVQAYPIAMSMTFLWKNGSAISRPLWMP
jgi:hypothetical protein